MELEPSTFQVAPKRSDVSWLGAREPYRTASLAADAALNLLATDPYLDWVSITHRRWLLTKVRKGQTFADVMERLGIAMAELPADGQKAPRGKRKLEVYEILKGFGVGEPVALELMTRLRPYLK